MQREFGVDAAREIREREGASSSGSGSRSGPVQAPPMEGRNAQLRSSHSSPGNNVNGGSGGNGDAPYESYGSKVREKAWLVLQNREYLKLVFGLSMFIGTMNR